MKASARMESLWTYIQSLSLSSRNKQWLAERLIESNQIDTPAAQAEEGMSKEEILHSIDQGVRELKLHLEGKLAFRRAEDLLDEL